MYADREDQEHGSRRAVLLAFTFFMGLMLARLLGIVLGMKNGTGLVMTAFAGTGVILRGAWQPLSRRQSSRDLTQMGKVHGRLSSAWSCCWWR